MAYFLGRDVEVAITTENTTQGLDYSDNGSAVTVASGVSGTGMMARGGGSGTDGADDDQIFESQPANFSNNPVKNLVGVELTLGTVDEDIAYMGQRTALKAEIKKETSVTLTMKKNESFFDALFNSARYGVDSSNALTDMGLTQPDVEFGYRLHVALKDGTEVISVPNCTFSEHGVTLNADGVQEETATFISHVTPIIGTGPSSDITTNL